MGKIIWLASYPKSGNTWFRVFLTNLTQDSDTPADINDLERTPIASARPLFDDAAGVEASDLTHDEIDRLRPLLYEQLAENSEETLFMKVHDAFTVTSDGTPMFARAATRGAIYFIRNPLDVAVSYAHHSAAPIDRTIKSMGRANHALVSNPNRLHNQLRQRLLTWSGHVLSWVDEPGLPVHVMRYEDMKRNTFDVFRGAVRFAGLPDDRARIEKALSFSEFSVLQAQEQELGFREKMPRSKSFFRKGETGSWREALTERQVQQIIADHGPVMRRFGYLGPDGTIVD
jgi:Sulfotransferase domain